MKLKLTWKNTIVFVMLITPFIDIINTLQRISGILTALSAGQVIRTALLAIMFFVLYIKDNNRFFILSAISVALLIRNCLYFFIYHASLYANISQDLRYIYVLTFAFLIHGAYKREVISWEEVYELTKKIIVIVAFTTVISNLVGVGVDYAGTKRLFIEVNALTAVLVWGTSIYLYELFLTKFDYKKLIVTLAVVYATISQATKTGLIGVTVCFLYFLFYMGVLKKRFIKWTFLVLVGAVASYLLYRYFSSGSGIDILKRWQYFYVNLDFTSFMLSGRNSLFETSFNVWKEDILFIMCGTGYSNANYLIRLINANASYSGAEMDLFDIGFYYGLFAMVAVGYPILKRFIGALINMWKNRKKDYLKLSYVLICIISFLGGHILSSPMAGIIFCASYIMTIDTQADNKKPEVRG